MGPSYSTEFDQSGGPKLKALGLRPELSPPGAVVYNRSSMHPSRHLTAQDGADPKRTAAGQIEQKIHWALHSEPA